MELVDIKQHREHEQQEFVRELAHEVHDKAEESGNYELYIFNVFLTLAEDMRARMLTRQGIPSFRQPQRSGHGWYLIEPTCAKIFAFKRVDSEVEYLEYLLAQELWGTVASEATRQYHHESIHEPEKVFDLSPLNRREERGD